MTQNKKFKKKERAKETIIKNRLQGEDTKDERERRRNRDKCNLEPYK